MDSLRFQPTQPFRGTCSMETPTHVHFPSRRLLNGPTRQKPRRRTNCRHTLRGVFNAQESTPGTAALLGLIFMTVETGYDPHKIRHRIYSAANFQLRRVKISPLPAFPDIHDPSAGRGKGKTPSRSVPHPEEIISKPERHKNCSWGGSLSRTFYFPVSLLRFHA